ncbi:hypothetical protein DXG01_003942 [Tephrocybe rancida]|nr:hypothetical protein DXG01_003942 [Tephrocybe rancida]
MDGKPLSKNVLAEMARLNLIVVRLGPGKHLEGKVLMSDFWVVYVIKDMATAPEAERA